MELEEIKEKAKELLDKQCPYYDDDCLDVKSHFDCWVGFYTNDPFPGTCPFIMKHNGV